MNVVVGRKASSTETSLARQISSALRHNVLGNQAQDPKMSSRIKCYRRQIVVAKRKAQKISTGAGTVLYIAVADVLLSQAVCTLLPRHMADLMAKMPFYHGFGIRKGGRFSGLVDGIKVSELLWYLLV